MDPNKMYYFELRMLAKEAKIPRYYVMSKGELSLALGLGPIEERKGGVRICAHGKQKRYCMSCGGAAICPHGIRKYVCIPCKGSQLCKHLKQKHQCRECKRERES